jgi:predicted nucleic acid-binding protein
LSSEFQNTLRRLKPGKHRAQLRPRAESELEFIETISRRPAKLLYDTTVYIDILQGRFPQQGEAMLRATEAWHSPVTEAELAATCGLLDPAHSQTPEIIEQVAEVIDRRPSYGTEHRRRVLNDALLFATARKHGCAVLSRNVRDFDFLQQLDPAGKVLFYKTGAL